MSPHAAALEAGFRRKTLQIDAGDAVKAAETLRRRCCSEFLDELGEALVQAERPARKAKRCPHCEEELS